MNAVTKPALCRFIARSAAWVCVLAFAAGVSAGPLPPGGPFTLKGQNGSVSLSDFRGKLVVLYFGYTSCADICPTAMSLIASALRQLPAEERSEIRGVFVTVDPERDTAAIASTYASQFDPRFTGLTGSVDEVRTIAARYGAQFKKVPLRSEMGYAVDHSSATYVINRQGVLVRVLKHGCGSKDILEALRAELGK